MSNRPENRQNTIPATKNGDLSDRQKYALVSLCQCLLAKARSRLKQQLGLAGALERNFVGKRNIFIVDDKDENRSYLLDENGTLQSS
jgi:hypothetical protein